MDSKGQIRYHNRDRLPTEEATIAFENLAGQGEADRRKRLDTFAMPGTNWIIIIAIFTASISLAGFTSRWLAAKMPALARFGFLLYLTTTTFYFCVITLLMQNILQQ